MHSPLSAEPHRVPAPPLPPPLIRRSLLRHGPRDLLDRFMIQAESEARQRGVTLEFGEASKFVSANGSNRDCWRSLVPVLDPRRGSLGDHNFCLFGLDHKGDIVATQVARLYDFKESNLRAEADAGRLMTPHDSGDGSGPAPEDRVRIFLNVPSAPRITGRAVYSGGTWYRPDYRGIGLSSILPRLGRAIALAMWNTDFFFSLVEPPLARQKMLDRYGYSNVEHGAKVTIGERVDFEGALIWMHRNELIGDLSWFVSGFGTQIDALPRRRSA